MTKHPHWIGYLRGEKEDVSDESLIDLYVCVGGLTDKQGLLLDADLSDVLQGWVVDKIMALKEKNT
jgi:hypothetical protein